MLGMFHLLPLLKGWEYKAHRIERKKVVRGADPIELRISEVGWLLAITELTDDCYGTITIQFQGADLETKTTSVNPEDLVSLGAFAQDPGGWIQRYFRPNPESTSGIFFAILFTGGYQGSVLPYVPTVVMKISLPAESTQETAYIGLTAVTIAITDKKAFLSSLRKVLGIQGEIDPSLLAVGPEK